MKQEHTSAHQPSAQSEALAAEVKRLKLGDQALEPRSLPALDAIFASASDADLAALEASYFSTLSEGARTFLVKWDMHDEFSAAHPLVAPQKWLSAWVQRVELAATYSRFGTEAWESIGRAPLVQAARELKVSLRDANQASAFFSQSAGWSALRTLTCTGWDAPVSRAIGAAIGRHAPASVEALTVDQSTLSGIMSAGLDWPKLRAMKVQGDRDELDPTWAPIGRIEVLEVLHSSISVVQQLASHLQPTCHLAISEAFDICDLPPYFEAVTWRGEKHSADACARFLESSAAQRLRSFSLPHLELNVECAESLARLPLRSLAVAQISMPALERLIVAGALQKLEAFAIAAPTSEVLGALSGLELPWIPALLATHAKVLVAAPTVPDLSNDLRFALKTLAERAGAAVDLSDEALAKRAILDWVASGDRPLASISGIERLTGLETARLSVACSSLEPLSLLPLRSLKLRGNVSRLAALTGLLNLEELDLCGTQITDVRPIATLPKLRRLHVGDLPLESSQSIVLSEMRARGVLVDNVSSTLRYALETLHLFKSSEAYDGANFDALQELEHCVELGWSQDMFHEVRSHAVNRVAKRREWWPVTSLDGLELATRLSFLQLTRYPTDPPSAHIRSLAPLAGLQQLSYLDVRGNTALQDIAPLAGLGALAELNLEETSVDDLRPLVGLPSLKKVLVSAGCEALPGAPELAARGVLEVSR